MIDVKLLLRANVAGVGRRGDIVEVSPGYARNFLVPRGLAIAATPGGAAQAEAMRKSQNLKDAKDRESAEEIAKTLVSRTINITARSASGGKLFGSVSSVEIAQAIADQANVELDRKSIHLDEHIKTTGSHQVQIRLLGGVEFPVTVEVTGS